MRYTLWQTNIAIENGTFIVDLPNLRMVIFYSYGTMLVCQRVYFLGARKKPGCSGSSGYRCSRCSIFFEATSVVENILETVICHEHMVHHTGVGNSVLRFVDLAVCIWQSSKWHAQSTRIQCGIMKEQQLCCLFATEKRTKMTSDWPNPPRGVRSACVVAVALPLKTLHFWLLSRMHLESPFWAMQMAFVPSTSEPPRDWGGAAL